MLIRVNRWYQRVNRLWPRKIAKKWIKARASSQGLAKEVLFKIRVTRVRRALPIRLLNWRWVPPTLRTQLKSINMGFHQQQIRHRLHSVLKSGSAQLVVMTHAYKTNKMLTRKETSSRCSTSINSRKCSTNSTVNRLLILQKPSMIVTKRTNKWFNLKLVKDLKLLPRWTIWKRSNSN